MLAKKNKFHSNYRILYFYIILYLCIEPTLETFCNVLLSCFILCIKLYKSSIELFRKKWASVQTVKALTYSGSFTRNFYEIVRGIIIVEQASEIYRCEFNNVEKFCMLLFCTLVQTFAEQIWNSEKMFNFTHGIFQVAIKFHWKAIKKLFNNLLC